MFKLLTAIIEDQIEYSLKRAFAPLAPYLKRLTLGVGALIIASSAFILGLLFVSLSIFFRLSAQLEQLSGPAIWVGGGSVAIAVIIAAIGLRFLKSPRV